MTKNRGITKSEFGRRIGVSKQMVGKYVALRMPTLKDGRIDPHAAQRWIAANIERRDAAGKPESLVMARTRKETALAGLRELELKKRTGELVEYAKIAAAWTDIAVRLRNAVLGIPACITNRLPAEWRHEIMIAATDEVRKILESLSNDIRATPAAAAATKEA